jgi:hypothetical protein
MKRETQLKNPSDNSTWTGMFKLLSEALQNSGPEASEFQQKITILLRLVTERQIPPLIEEGAPFQNI